MNHKNICFISIFDLTILQYEIASKLETRGHTNYWITTSSKWTAWLLKKGVRREHILELVFKRADFLSNSIKQEVVKNIFSSEQHTSFTANMSLLADRFVLSKNNPDINEYVCLYHHHIQKFLDKHHIDIVFGEPTNTNELITSMICAQKGIPFLFPQCLRFPSGRFYFEHGVATGKMATSGKENIGASGKEILDRYRQSSAHPEYFHRNNRRSINISRAIGALINRVKGIFDAKDNLTHHLLIPRIFEKFRVFVNRLYLLHVCSYNKLEDIPGKLAFFGLHVQPEASIDVLGPYFSDQLKLIKDMRRALPFDTTLVIKEHPNFLGLKPIRFFREIQKIPNTKMVHPDTSSFDIYKRANLVLTVSGTTAYEAGMLGIPAITFTPMYFSGFSSVYHCSDITHLKTLAFKLLSTERAVASADYEVMDSILRNSFAGYWNDPFSDAKVLNQSNVDALMQGFIDVIENVVYPRPAYDLD